MIWLIHVGCYKRVERQQLDSERQSTRVVRAMRCLVAWESLFFTVDASQRSRSRHASRTHCDVTRYVNKLHPRGPTRFSAMLLETCILFNVFCVFGKKHAAFKWKDALFWFSVSPGSAEAQVRWGGKIKYILIAYFLGNICAINYRNRTVHVKIIASQRRDVFFETRCISGEQLLMLTTSKEVVRLTKLLDYTQNTSWLA